MPFIVKLPTTRLCGGSVSRSARGPELDFLSVALAQFQVRVSKCRNLELQCSSNISKALLAKLVEDRPKYKTCIVGDVVSLLAH